MSSTIDTAQDAAVEPKSVVPSRKRKPLGKVFWISVGWIGLVFLLAIIASWIGLEDPNNGDYALINAGPSWGHPFGTDDLGRDILSRVIYGARVSLPALVAVIAIVAFWGHEIWKITIIVGIASTPLVYRVIRAATLSYATREFVTAAKAQGATDTRILTRELLPNVLPTVISYFLIGVATVIILEGALAFLGLSVPAPTASWGNMINESRTYLSDNPWLALFPSLAMFLFLIALNLVGDTLRQSFDVQESKL